jgi:hypothetical protein
MPKPSRQKMWSHHAAARHLSRLQTARDRRPSSPSAHQQRCTQRGQPCSTDDDEGVSMSTSQRGWELCKSASLLRRDILRRQQRHAEVKTQLAQTRCCSSWVSQNTCRRSGCAQPLWAHVALCLPRQQKTDTCCESCDKCCGTCGFDTRHACTTVLPWSRRRAGWVWEPRTPSAMSHRVSCPKHVPTSRKRRRLPPFGPSLRWESRAEHAGCCGRRGTRK